MVENDPSRADTVDRSKPVPNQETKSDSRVRRRAPTQPDRRGQGLQAPAHKANRTHRWWLAVHDRAASRMALVAIAVQQRQREQGLRPTMRRLRREIPARS